MRFLHALERAPRAPLIIACCALVVLTAWINYLTDAELAFSVFFLVPISVASWVVGRGAGMSLSVAASALWIAGDVAGPQQFPVSWLPWVNQGFRLVLFLSMSWLLPFLRDTLRREAETARQDSLTGVGNRRYFFEAAAMELRRARRYGTPITTVFLDIDDFKRVNDELGHLAGDELLRLVASTLRASIREIDCLARQGGDEFILLLPQTDAGGAGPFLARLKEEIDRAMKARGWAVTVSMGAATFVRAPDEEDELVRAADAAMYAVKQAGKCGIRHEVIP